MNTMPGRMNTMPGSTKLNFLERPTSSRVSTRGIRPATNFGSEQRGAEVDSGGLMETNASARSVREADPQPNNFARRLRDAIVVQRPVYIINNGLTIRGGYVGDRWRVSGNISSSVLGLASHRIGQFDPSITWVRSTSGSRFLAGYWQPRGLLNYSNLGWCGYEWNYGRPSAWWVQRGADDSMTRAVGPGTSNVFPYAPMPLDPRLDIRWQLDPGDMIKQAAVDADSLSEHDRALESALASWRGGDAKNAVAQLRTHLRNPQHGAIQDVRGLRLLSAALIEAGEPVDAAAVMRLAYELDPSLATERLELSSIGIEAARIRQMVERSVGYANTVGRSNASKGVSAEGSASAWLVVSVLMREQDRNELARTIFSRAKAAGLREDIVAAVELAWR